MRRGSPFISMRAWDEQNREAGDEVDDAIMQRLTFAEFVDTVDGDDVLTLKFENQDLKLFDNGLLFHWSRFAVVYGYTDGETSPRRIMEVQDIRGGDEITVILHEGHSFIGQDFLFFDVNRPNSRISIPDRNAITNKRGFIFGLGDQSITTHDMIQRIVQIIANENGYRDEEIIWQDTPPNEHPLISEFGFYISRERGVSTVDILQNGTRETGPLGESLTYAKVLDILMTAMDWRWRIHNGLLILEPNDHVEDADIELLYKTVEGEYASEFQHHILDGTLDVDADVRQLPRTVQALGFDPQTGRHISARADTTETDRRVPKAGPQTGSPTDRSTLVANIETMATTQAGADNAAATALTAGEKDLVELKADVEGVPRTSAGSLILLTCPSVVISGGYTIIEAIHKIIDERSPYMTAYTLERRFVQKVEEIPPPDDPKPPEPKAPKGVGKDQAALIETAIADGNYGYRSYNDGGTLKRRTTPGNPATSPTVNVPRQ